MVLTKEVNAVPNIQSAKKRVLVAEKKNMRNRMIKSTMRTSVKRFETAAAQEQTTDIEQLYKNAISKVNRACTKGVLHRNTASRKISQLSKLYNSMAK